jgi:hypothetical protein
VSAEEAPDLLEPDLEVILGFLREEKADRDFQRRKRQEKAGF